MRTLQFYNLVRQCCLLCVLWLAAPLVIQAQQFNKFEDRPRAKEKIEQLK